MTAKIHIDGDDSPLDIVMSISRLLTRHGLELKTTSLMGALEIEVAHTPRTPREQEFDEIVKSVVLKPGEHQVRPNDPEAPRLYAVTTIASSDRYGGTRTPVVCSTFERAREIVETNECDIFECSYQLVVIEAFRADRLYATLDEQYWYVWKTAAEKPDGLGPGGYHGRYHAIETPERYRGVVGWGIG